MTGAAIPGKARPERLPWQAVERAVGGLALLALAACQAVPGAREAPRDAPPVATPAPAVAPSPPIASVPSAPKLPVALLVPLTGENAGVGASIANAARLALADAGGEGITLETYDTGQSGAAAAAERALAAGARLILGPLTGRDARAVGAVAWRADVPAIAFSNDRSAAGEGVYLLGVQPEDSVRRVVAHARAGGATRFAALIPTGEYGERARLAFRDAVGDAGGRLAGVAFYDRSRAALTAAVARVEAGPPADAVLIADTGAMARIAAPLLKRGPLAGARLLGTELWGADAGLGSTPALVGARFAAAPDAAFDQLAERYRAQRGRTPYRLASYGYDAVLLAIRASRDWRPGAPFPSSRLADREGFSGVDGPYRFRADGTAERRLAVIEVTPTGERVVAEAPDGFGG